VEAHISLLKTSVVPYGSKLFALKNGAFATKNTTFEAHNSASGSAVVGYRGAVVGYKGAVVGYRSAVAGYRSAVVGYRDAVVGYRGAVVGYRDAVVGYRDAVVGYRGAVVGYRDEITHGMTVLSIHTSEVLMAHGDWLPHVEAVLVLLLTKWKAWLSDTAKQTAFGWEAAACGAVVSRIDDFLDALTAYQADNSSGNLLAKNEAKKAAVAVVRSFANTSVRFNEKMTEADRLALGIHPRDATQTAHPVPSAKPEVDAAPSGQGRHTVTAINPATQNKKKPALVKGVAFACKVRLSAEPKADPKEMASDFQAAAVKNFQWAEADYGKVADYAAAYENEGGKRGPWSDVASVIIA
jgi:hypothetical protein